MKKSREFLINDVEMYRYFEQLIYGESSGLLKRWKVKHDTLEYGLTERNVSKLIGTKELLYGEEDAEKQICLLETLEEFLHEYIGIRGLEELFINNYGEIENSIFLEHDAEGNPRNIREHAKHQMKNAYLGSVLLLECGYLQDMAKKINQEQSPVTRRLTQEVRAFLEKSEETEVLKKLEELIYKIFMVSSLLHDIGYPLAYYLRSAKQMTEYPPYLKILCPTVKAEFADIKSSLLDSWLFRYVDAEKIQGKYVADDHGALSALSLLMHFYHNGRIHFLKPEERCIVEMAAVAIYHHTDRFPKGLRMVYLTDPVSFMVRLCDDMQEWDRFKILINGKHNFLQCGQCGRLIKENRRLYQCKCGRSYEKVTMIQNRKLNYVCLCDELRIEKREKSVNISAKFHFLKQLEILLDDYSCIVKTAGDMEKIQKMLEGQSFCPEMKVNYFVSNNPVEIIKRMIQDSGKKEEQIKNWMEQELSGERQQVFREFWDDFKEKKKENPFGGIIEKNQLKYEKKVQEYVLTYYGQIYSLYKMLYL